MTRSGDDGLRAEAVYTTLSARELFGFSQALLLGLVALAIILVVFIGMTYRSERSEGGLVYTAPSGPESVREPRSEEETVAYTKTDGSHQEHEEGLYSEYSGFCRKMFLKPRLESELKRAAAFDQDLVLAFVRCLEDQGGDGMDESSKELYEHATTFFPFQDLLFEYDSQTFAVILPNTDLDQGIELLTNFQLHLFETEGCCQFETAVGLSARNGRLIDQERIITETRAALNKAEEDPETKLIGFRPDPGKYRSYLAQKKPS
jgi:hypothetical protein